MESFQPEQFRFYIFMRSQLGENATKIHSDLVQVTGAQAPSYRTVARWIETLGAGRASLNDDPRSGRPSTAVTEENIAAVRALVDEDPNITIATISETIGIADGSVHTILHGHLGLRKVTARWVPHHLSEEQKRERVRCSQEFLRNFAQNSGQRLSDIVTGDEKWFYYFQTPQKVQNKAWIGAGDERPTVLRPSFRSRKEMFVIFVSNSGPVSVIMVPNGQNVNASFYSGVVLPHVVATLHTTQPSRVNTGRIHLHHDNASSHTAAMTTRFLADNKLKIIRHPPYSPDLAPCDFWVFPKLTERLAGRHFERPQDLARCINSELKVLHASEYCSAFEAWIRRHQKCIERGGEYIEGL